MEAFAKMPVWLFPMGLSSNAKVLYVYLYNAQRMNGEIHIPIDKLADGIHVSRSTVKRSLGELEEAKLIRISRQFSNSVLSIEVLENENCQFKMSWHDRPNWTGGQFKMNRLTGQNEPSDSSNWTGALYIKENNKRNIKRTAKRTRAQCAYNSERPTYDTNLFRKKDSFPEEQDKRKRG